MKKLFLGLVVFVSVIASAQKSSVIYDDHAQVRKVSGFNAIKVSNAIDLYLTQSNSNQVAVSANNEENRDRIITEVVGGTLIIRMAENDGWWSWKKWSDVKAKAYVSIKEIDAITASGATNVRLVNKFESPKLKVKLSGASDFKGEIEAGSMSIHVSGASDFKGILNAKSLTLNASGASVLELGGSVDDLSIEVSGASDVKLFNLLAKGAFVNASGASTANIHASQLIKIEASGASSINYKGEAKMDIISNSGSSSIRHKN
jgi:hypothetical protein